MINKKEVYHIAELARLKLNEKEVKDLQKDLSLILDYIANLEKADVSKVDITSRPGQLINIFRKDVALEKSGEMAGKLLQSASDKKDGYIKVKPVLQ